MPELVDDQSVWPKMLDLRQCLCEEIEKSGLPSVCFCEVMPGALAPYDYADDGMAWVRLVTSYPSIQFPVQTQDLRRSCASPLASQIEVAIVRCAPRMQRADQPVPAEQEYEATRIQLADMAAMKRAIQCCFGKRDAVLGSYTPIGPDDGGIGGSWTVFV